MSDYLITWITSNLAVGYAPMSYAELDSIRQQGIGAIVNLCGEYCDLHEIEESAGFEVFFLPIPDETAFGMAEMESALEWLDEAIYLGKKVLVHCRHGIGRTGTFVTAYLLRRGFSLKQAGKMLKETRANPTNFSQWWLLRKFGRKEGQLKVQVPTPNNRQHKELGQFFGRYEKIIEEIDHLKASLEKCAIFSVTCAEDVNIEIIEALYLHEKANITLTSAQRNNLIERISAHSTEENELSAAFSGNAERAAEDCYCILSKHADGLLYRFRPVNCRIKQSIVSEEVRERINKEIAQLSQEVFFAIFDQWLEAPPRVSIKEVISGKFIEVYFQYIASQTSKANR
jgi:protein-tyrosine phosphatase